MDFWISCSCWSNRFKSWDEVIVTPNTMSATITSIMHWGAIPIFCDIENNYFNIDTRKIPKLITKKQKLYL